MKHGGLALLLAFVSALSHGVSAENDLAAFQDRVQEAYLAYYGRPADPGGLGFWTQRLATADGDLGLVIEAFGNSSEFVDRFGSLDTETLVNNMYIQLFGRGADPEGLAFYSEAYNSGRLTLPSIALAILYGVKPRSSDGAIVFNRVSFSKSYTELVASGDIRYELNRVARELLGISGNPGSLERAVRDIFPTAQVYALIANQFGAYEVVELSRMTSGLIIENSRVEILSPTQLNDIAVIGDSIYGIAVDGGNLYEFSALTGALIQSKSTGVAATSPSLLRLDGGLAMIDSVGVYSINLLTGKADRKDQAGLLADTEQDLVASGRSNLVWKLGRDSMGFFKLRYFLGYEETFRDDRNVDVPEELVIRDMEFYDQSLLLLSDNGEILSVDTGSYSETSALWGALDLHNSAMPIALAPADRRTELRFVYATPLDRTYNPEYAKSILAAAEELQLWLKSQLAGETFSIFRNRVETCVMEENSDYFRRSTWTKVLAEIQRCAPVENQYQWNPAPDYVWVVYADVLHECGAPGRLGAGGDGLTMMPRQDLDGLIGVSPIIDDCGVEYRPPIKRWTGGLGHEVGHALYLPHPPGCDGGLPECDYGALMWGGYWSFPATYLRPEEKEALRSHPAIFLE